LFVASAALGQTVQPSAESIGTAPAAPAVKVSEPVVLHACDRWRDPALGEGPVALGYGETDVATGRRACPRSEVGLGGRVGLIVDTPHFYGNIVAEGIVFASAALSPRLELFGTLTELEYNWVQNATLKGSTLSLGTLTLGVTRHIYGNSFLQEAFSVRAMLPTSFVTPHARPIGIELGHVLTWRPKSWLEIHTYLGTDLSAALGSGPALPQFGGIVTLGVQWSPVSFAAIVVDATGRAGAKTFFAATGALRLRIYSLGIELAATAPLVGDDRHDVILGGRFSLRL
jgi:hypothetical protein